MKTICIIPARAGSKGIKKKNITLINGKPMIAYSIIEALKSENVDVVVVSTESQEIASISKKYGAEVPFLRPEEYSKDEVHALYPVMDCLKKYERITNTIFDRIVMLLPTSPLRRVKHIDEAIKIFDNNNGSVISVTKVSKAPQYIKMIEKNKLIPYIKLNNPNFNRQELPDYYVGNGSIFISSRDALLEQKTFHQKLVYPYIMNKFVSVDVDEEFDLRIVKELMKGE